MTLLGPGRCDELWLHTGPIVGADLPGVIAGCLALLRLGRWRRIKDQNLKSRQIVSAAVLKSEGHPPSKLVSRLTSLFQAPGGARRSLKRPARANPGLEEELSGPHIKGMTGGERS